MLEPTPTAPTPQVERRALPRFQCRENTRARFTVRPSFRQIWTDIRDASATGIGFLIDAPLEVGTVLALQLQAGTAGISCIRTARVVHATPHEGRWLIGCQVSPPFSRLELESLR